MYGRDPHGKDSEVLAGFGKGVAWIDYDNDSARAVFRNFVAVFADAQRKLRTHHDVEFFGADVMNEMDLENAVRRAIQRKPAVIVATSVLVAQAVRRASSGIPMYFVIQSDPSVDGIVDSSRKPGRNTTGYTFFLPVDSKIVELAKYALPDLRSIGIVTDQFWTKERNMTPTFFADCKLLEVKVKIFQAERPEDLRKVLHSNGTSDIDAWYVPYGTLAFEHGREVVDILRKTGKPTFYARSKFVDMGGMISLQPVDASAMATWADTLLDILDGIPAGDIPVVRPKQIEVSVSARELAALSPETRRRVLISADRVLK